jgi:hypothetical protein
MRLAGLLCLLLALTGISAAQDTNFLVGPQYLMTSVSPLFAQPIATPSLALEAPLPAIPSLPQIGPAVENGPLIANPELRHQADLFPIYYGSPATSVVEITSAEPSRELPASILDTGVTGMTTVQSLRQRGYGASVGEAAAFWKAHKSHASRRYTNADVQRLHPS